jgi:hypothetical protein
MLRPTAAESQSRLFLLACALEISKGIKRMSVSGSPPNPDSLMCRCFAQSIAASCINTPRVLAINRPVSIPPPHWRPRHATYPSLSECAKPPACQLTLSIKGTQTGYRRSECLVRKFCTSECPRWPWKSVQSLASADAKKPVRPADYH